MDRRHVLDTALDNPDLDLLNMCGYARILAEYIRATKPPFTIGIYGEWGSGKTSFVQFAKYYLEHPNKPPVKFIKFEAWPYQTSDELWRALIFTIAQELYDVAKREAAPDQSRTSETASLGIVPWLTKFLKSDAIVLRQPPPIPDPNSDYNELMAKLDRAPYGSISKDAKFQLQFNEEQTIVAIVNAASAALATMSPLVAGIRSLFNLDSKIDLKDVLQKERNDSVREKIQSVEQFRTIFKDVVSKKAGDKLVCVFIDDLDRCMPDAALDVLEAIKIFLYDVPCVFLVAADEELIAQGLRLRFKDLSEQETQDRAQEFFNRKGQEYLEKILQLRIRVPRRTYEETHNFIAAQFPVWMPATDLIEAAIGGNPRRLKQFCNLLSYKYLVARSEGK